MWLSKKKGFTLIELLVVVAIMGIIAAVSVPIVINQIDRANEKSDIANLESISNNVFIDITELNNRGVPITMRLLMPEVYDDYQGTYNVANPVKSNTSAGLHLILPIKMSVPYPVDDAFYTVALVTVKDGKAVIGNGYEIALYKKGATVSKDFRRIMVKGLQFTPGNTDVVVVDLNDKSYDYKNNAIPYTFLDPNAGKNPPAVTP